MLMGAARLDIPAIIVTAGPMLSGRYDKRKLAFVHDTYEALSRAKKGEISAEELSCLEMEACPGAGSCQGLYTANTMACLTETMGMSLPGCHCLAVSAKNAALPGWRSVSWNWSKRMSPQKTCESFTNAIVVDMALGGSNITVLHLMANPEQE
jgi:dihydroxy-acid dehydratase